MNTTLPEIGTRKTFKVQLFRGDMGSYTTNAKNCNPKITRN